MLPGDVLDDVLVGHDLIGHAREGREAQVDLALASRCDLVVVELAGDAEALEREHHLRTEVVELVRRRGGEVPLLRSGRVPEPGPSGVPVALRGVDRVVRAVGAEVVVHLVEDEELALGAEIGGVGDPARPQVLLRPASDPTRILRVRLAGDRIGDLADERERGRLGRRVENRGGRIRHEQHVRVLNRLPTADRGAVEAETLVEGALVERSRRQRHVLPGAEQVAELEIDHRRLGLRRPLERLARIRQRLAAVSQVVPLLDLRHLASSIWTKKKTPGLETES